MKSTEIALTAACALACVLCIALLVLYLKNRRSIIGLSESIDNFIEGRGETEFSARDNAFARLQNGVSELEGLLTLERGNRASEAKKNADFVADVSHQLKTPLAGIRLYCELQQDLSPNLHSEKELQLIEKMEKLIYNLLRLEKLKSDAYVMDLQTYELNAIVCELCDEFSHLFKNKRYSICGDAELRCDKQWLGEAIGNVIKNAGEHTPDGGRIDITIKRGEGFVTLTVEDDGGGISGQELPKLFERFYRSQNAAPDSAGIGLAITRAIIEKHHATVFAENGRNGLRVVMCFPVIDGSRKI